MIRIGILGCARIAAKAMIKPAKVVAGVKVTAIAARDPARAVQYARRHDVPTVHRTYMDLVADPSIDAVYIPLPNSLHCRWTLAALDAGKHVLCEKPMASNAGEALVMAQRADAAGLVLMEAFHYRYHPCTLRMLEIVQGDELGDIGHVDGYFCSIIRKRNDIRLQYDLGGGAMMDMGCYPLHMIRTLLNMEPTVTHSTARTWTKDIDRRMEVGLSFPESVTGCVVCSMLSRTLLRIQLVVHGEHGTLKITNPVLPQYGHLLQMRTRKGRRWETVSGASTYTYQLQAFADAIRSGQRPITDAWDAVRNMKAIDAAYRLAGLPVRGMATT